jgi:hypothetical protein
MTTLRSKLMGRQNNPAAATKPLNRRPDAENLRIGVDEVLTPTHLPAGFRFGATRAPNAAAG